MPSILVLDDEPALTKLLVIILEQQGYTVRGFTNPLEALESLENFTPDAIISDVSMPLMGGLEFCRRVRLIAKFEGIPVIFLSALAERRDVREGMNVGADDFQPRIMGVVLIMPGAAGGEVVVEGDAPGSFRT